MTLTLFGSKNTRAFRCFWMLEELEVEYRVNEINLQKGEGRSSEYLAINPTGKVPALQDGDFLLIESAAINAYLADKFPEKNLIPAHGSTDRALYNQWGFYVLSELEQPLWLFAKHSFIYPEERRLPGNQDCARYEFKRAVKIIESHLATREYMVGETFTGADILVAQTLMWAQMVKFPLDAPASLEFIARMKDREGYKRAISV